jgi:hypothetical protein
MPCQTYNDLQAEFAQELADIADAAERAQRLNSLVRGYKPSPESRKAAIAAHQRFWVLGEGD